MTAGPTPLKLGKNEIVVFEGIHALNNDIAGRHPEATKLYISARSNVNEGLRPALQGHLDAPDPPGGAGL